MSGSNLPSQLSTFIGREREIATANRLLNGTRLLTLLGPGGCGKTRLALAVAQGVLRRYPAGAWLVELAPISDPNLVPQAVASALGLYETPGRPLLDTLVAFLEPRRLLLVLDNCEHVIEASAKLAHALLTACPGLRILATSREPLHVTGETTWTMPPLATPALGALPPLEDLRRIEAVRLFVERARHIAPDFALDRDNAQAVSQICRSLAGSPLAIELAAARIRLLSPEQIAARLEDALGLLATADRTVPARHRSLQATLDWSYNLLSPAEQSLFRRLAVFAAGFSLEGAEAACPAGECAEDGTAGAHSSTSAGDAAPVAVLDLLSGLVDKSLLEVEVLAGAERRYRYLEPVRQYAAAKLESSGHAPDARDRLVAWAVAFAERAEPYTAGSSAKPHLEQLETEHPNLRVALQWALSHPPRVVELHRLVQALATFWQRRGYICEGLNWYEQSLAVPGEVPVPLQVETFYGAGFLAMHAHDLGAARRYLEHALELAQASKEQRRIGVLYHFLGWLALSEGRLEEADALCAEALRVHEQDGNTWGRSVALFIRADLDYLRGDYVRARRTLEETIVVARDLRRAALARWLVRLAQICLIEGDHEEAGRCLSESLRTCLETGDRWGMAVALAGTAALGLRRGQHERTAWLMGVTQYFRDVFGVPFWAVDETEYNHTQSELRSLLGETGYQAAIARGVEQATRDPDVAVRLIVSMFARATSAQDKSAPDTPARSASTQDETAHHAIAEPRPIPPPPPAGFTPLSRREREVAALVAQGKSNAEIAATLFVGLRTVEAHVTHILNKLGFNSRAQIAAWMAGQPPTPTESPRRTR